ncbi:hypothetical protein L6164_022611 [Bauhinia variegata]|uniref:Uncharacterized protein n=1 Tax=Bauhinia variegata TaxID=167791 RepID=A0ACB9MIM3_BAUVA|nr:hypothetical protein L6164_022611 [Bauhinia variegata]
MYFPTFPNLPSSPGSGCLEILDQRTSAASTTTSSETATTPVTGFFVSFLSHVLTFLSLFTLNPFAKLTADDFVGDTPSWSRSFIGFAVPTHFLRLHLRLAYGSTRISKRYARNYAYLFILFFVCALYKMAVALVGLIS